MTPKLDDGIESAVVEKDMAGDAKPKDVQTQAEMSVSRYRGDLLKIGTVTVDTETTEGLATGERAKAIDVIAYSSTIPEDEVAGSEPEET